MKFTKYENYWLWLIMANIKQPFWVALIVNFSWITSKIWGSFISELLRASWHSEGGWPHLWTGRQPLSHTKYLVLFNYIFHITFSNNNYESTTHLYSTFVYFDEKTIFESKSWFCKTIFFHSLHTCKNPQKIQLFLCQIFQCTRKC